MLRIVYHPHSRTIVLLSERLPLLRFRRPEYVTAGLGQVTWRIEKGLLVARAGRGRGYLRLTIRQVGPGRRAETRRVHLRAEVSNFYPFLRGSGIFARIGVFVYTFTQLKIHELVTRGFLRSLARLDLPPSPVGALRDPADPAEPIEPAEPAGPPRRRGLSVRFEAPCEAPREELWSLLARPDRWREWAPHVRGASGLGSPEVTEGKRGRASLIGFEIVPATVLGVVPGRSWTWRVGPLELTHAVEPAPSGCLSVIEVHSRGLAGRLAAAAYAPAVWALNRNLARVAARSSSATS
ncbi:MAG: SRPBCC family protein [Solirubrobacterales bacterium]|nr:SRPBCC family protein [Solirubrobacterales bacterium]